MMDQNILQQIIDDQLLSLNAKNNDLDRSALGEKLLSNPFISVISGLRRSGKSTLMLQLAKKFPDFYYIDFDDERFLQFEVNDFNNLVIALKKRYHSTVFFLDEIQNINGWERFVRRLHNEGNKVFITGSNAKLLSGELASHLTGRYLKMELYPFSFKEILDYKNVKIIGKSSQANAGILNEFDTYVENGGIPDFIKYNNTEFLKRLYEDVIQKDLIAKFGIRNNLAFRKITQYLMTNFTKEISYNSLSRILGIQSVNSIKDYIGILQDSYLIFELYKYDYSLKRQYTSNKKIYTIDNGIRNRVAFRFGQDLGNLLENIVFIELKRRKKELYFYKTKNNLEVDFFVKENHPQLIQVSYSIEDYNTKERELKSLKTAMDELNLKEGLILTYNSFDNIKMGNKIINIRPTWKWLIEEQNN